MKFFNARFIFYLGLTAAVIGVKIAGVPALEDLEWKFQDMLYSFKQDSDTSEHVAIVAIDNLSIKEIGEWPWSEEAIADLVAAVGSAEPGATLIDFPISQFSDANVGEIQTHGLIAQQMLWMKNVVISYPIVPGEKPSDTVSNPQYLFRNAMVTANDLGALEAHQATPAIAVALPADDIKDAAARMGFTYSRTQEDGVLRTDPLAMNFQGYYYPSAPLSTAAMYLKVSPESIVIHGGESVEALDRQIPTDETGAMYLNFPSNESRFQTFSATDILNQRVDFNELRGKAVVIALTVPEYVEYFQTPVSKELPHYLKDAIALDNILGYDYLRRADSNILWYSLVLAFVGILCAVGLPMISAAYRVAIVALGLIALANVNYFLFTSFNLLANSVYVAVLLILFLIATPLVGMNYNLFKRKSEEDDADGEKADTTAKSTGKVVKSRRVSQARRDAEPEYGAATIALRTGDASETMAFDSNATMVLRGNSDESGDSPNAPGSFDSNATMVLGQTNATPSAPVQKAPAEKPKSAGPVEPPHGHGDINPDDLDVPLQDNTMDRTTVYDHNVDPTAISLDDKAPIESSAPPSESPADHTAIELPSADSQESYGQQGSDSGGTQNQAQTPSDSQSMQDAFKAGMSNTPLPTSGGKLGRYVIEGIVGKGAMGTVYRGVDPAINRHVALKTIRLDFLTDPSEIEEMKERLFLEARAAGKLSHPNIVTVYDVGSEGTTQYIAMEFLQGQTLESMIKRKVNFNFKIIANIIYQICSALQYAHDQGIVHRDIKPANIMVLPDFSIKVMDFGIARVESTGMTKTGVAMGTPNYISPEQLHGKQIDGRSDIFSLGVVFYEMLLGARPFKGDNLTSLIFSILHDEPEKPSKSNSRIPPLFDLIVTKALKKSPAERYQRASDMAAALSDFVQSFAVR